MSSNMWMARTYAEQILAFFRDLRYSDDFDDTESVYILELGAGSGRFSYHLINTLKKLCDESPFKVPKFVYIISDFVEENIEFCKNHNKLSTFIDDGILDFAYFDAVKSDEVELAISKKVIKKNSLEHPLVGIANYFFDSLPQDLIYSENKELKHVYISLSTDEYTKNINEIKDLEILNFDYTYNDFNDENYDLDMKNILNEYKENCSQTHILFPRLGMECIKKMFDYSHKGCIILTSDKGFYKEEELFLNDIPELENHGSFSFNVNYHAFMLYTVEKKGIALFPDNNQNSIITGCLIMQKDSKRYVETINSYNKFVNKLSPDDFFNIREHVERTMDNLSIDEFISYIRFSNYDSCLFAQISTKLIELSSDCSSEDKNNIYNLVKEVWENYYPLKENINLSYILACLLFELDLYEEALEFLKISLDTYGERVDIYYNMTLCYMKLDEKILAREYMKKVTEIDPEAASLFVP